MIVALPSAPEPVAPKPPGVPVRNLWHMLLYAWNLASVSYPWLAGVEDAPTLDVLFADILVKGVRRQLRRGLGRAYKTQAQTLRGIRGRIDFTGSLKRLTFANGQAHCHFQEFSVNVPRNQIIRSTLAMLARDGAFGIPQTGTEDLRHNMRRLVRDLDGIDLVQDPLELIGRQHLGRNDTEYRIMLNVCEMAWRHRMPTESSGAKSMSALDRALMTLHDVYERFVSNFYRLRLQGWNIGSQVHMSWNAEQSSPLLPGLQPDLRFRHHETGRLVILDTKFTPNIVITSRSGKDVFNSSHLYQIYAYLRSQEHLSDIHRSATGILLYPTADLELDDTVILQGHPIRIVTINLAQPWPDIEEGLLGLFP